MHTHIITTRPNMRVRAPHNRRHQVLNEMYSVKLRAVLSRPHGGGPADDAALISIDRLGADVRVRFGTDYGIERVCFETVRAAGWLAVCGWLCVHFWVGGWRARALWQRLLSAGLRDTIARPRDVVGRPHR